MPVQLLSPVSRAFPPAEHPRRQARLLPSSWIYTQVRGSLDERQMQSRGLQELWEESLENWEIHIELFWVSSESSVYRPILANSNSKKVFIFSFFNLNYLSNNRTSAICQQIITLIKICIMSILEFMDVFHVYPSSSIIRLRNCFPWDRGLFPSQLLPSHPK